MNTKIILLKCGKSRVRAARGWNYNSKVVNGLVFNVAISEKTISPVYSR